MRTSLLAATALSLAAVPAAAQIAQTWTGNASTDWFDGANWDSGTVPAAPPGPADSVTIDTVTPNPTVLDGSNPAATAVDLNGLNVGYTATGQLLINNGATVSVTGNTAVVGGDLSGVANSASGSVIVDGAGTTFSVTGSPPGAGMIVVGGSGTGAFTVRNGASVSTVDSYVGFTQGVSGTVTVTGAGSTWTNSDGGGNGENFVGNYGTGVFNVLNGASVSVDASTILGAASSGNGTINISGTGSSWTTSGLTLLGGSVSLSDGGRGTINVSNGGSYVAHNDLVIGFKIGSTGAFNVSGGGTVTVDNNGTVQIGLFTTATGSLTITGAGSLWDATAGGDMIIGGNVGGFAPAGGTGTVNVLDGGALNMQGAMYIGRGSSGGNGTLNVDGAGSAVAITNTNDSLFVGTTGIGVMNITNGAQVTNDGFAYVGYFAGSQGVVNIDGAGSTWTSNGPVTVIGGNQGADAGGTGVVNVRNGATFNTADAALGLDSTTTATGTVNVTGAGSTWNANTIYVGYESIGILNIASGGRVSAATMSIGDCACANGTVNIGGASTLFVATDLFVGNLGTGAMTASGAGTTVSAGGALVVGLAGTGSLTIQNGASVSASTVILGFNPGFSSGTVNVLGAGSTLTSANGLAVGFGAPDGVLNILDGGRVDVGGLVFSDGRITIGAGSALNSGGLSLSSTATTTFGLRGSSAGQINLGTGAAVLDGALTITGRNVARTTYTLVRSGDLGGTTFGSVTYDPQLRNPVLTYTLTDVLLTVDQFLLSSIVPTAANTNQHNVTQAIDNAIAAGATPSSALENIYFLSGSQVLNALSQLSGESGGGAQHSALTGANLFMGSVFDNAFGAPGGNPGQGDALGYAAQRKISSAAQEAYAAVTPRDRLASFEQRWSVWGAGYGGSSRVSGDGGTGSHDTTSRVYGVSAGATWRASPDLQLGFALGGAGSNFSVAEGFGSGKADTFNAALYGRYTMGPAYIAAALGYSWQDATTDRTVSAGGATETLHASFSPQALSTRLEGGRRFVTTAFGITPYAAVQTTTLFMPSYGETATSGTGVFALSYGSRDVTATRGELGARFDRTVMLGGRPVALKAKAAWAHDWNTERLATATFQQLPGATFTVNGAEPAANSALLSFGADVALSRGWSLGAGFDGEFSRTTASYAGKGSLRYSW